MKTPKTPWFLHFAQAGILTTTASVVVGILLSGSLLLYANPIGGGRFGNLPPIVDVRDTVVSAIYVSNHGSYGITQYSPSILTGGFSTYRGLRTINDDDNTVYLDWFQSSRWWSLF